MIILLYIIAMIPVAMGAFMWITNHKINWLEWVSASIIGFILAGIFHLIGISGMTSDRETWSGWISSTTLYPEWIEKYKVKIYRNESYTYRENGKTKRGTKKVFSHYEDRYQTHPERYSMTSNLHGELSIDLNQHVDLRQKFGNNIEKIETTKSGFYSGDKNIYTTNDDAGYLQPCTTWKYFENRVKASPSLFSYVKIDENMKDKLFKYPTNDNILASNRVLGTAITLFPTIQWDRMNSILGPSKKVNVIVIGFPSGTPANIAQYQEAYWIGGRKNDLVITYSETNGKADWCHVFGWTEKTIVKENIESLFMTKKLDLSLIKDIQEEIVKNYIIKDWSKFDYLTIEPPVWTYIVLTIVMVIIQSFFWYWALKNEHDKGDAGLKGV